MTAPRKPDLEPSEGNAGERTNGKRPYQKPAFTREQLFETMALACGKLTGAGGQCQFVKKTS